MQKSQHLEADTNLRNGFLGPGQWVESRTQLAHPTSHRRTFGQCIASALSTLRSSAWPSGSLSQGW